MSFLVHVLCVIIYCIQHMEGIYSRPMHLIEELIKKRRGRSQYPWPQPSTQTGEVFLPVMSSWDSRRWRIDWLESIWVHVKSEQIFAQTFLSLVYDIAVKKSWKNTHKKLLNFNLYKSHAYIPVCIPSKQKRCWTGSHIGFVVLRKLSNKTPQTLKFATLS